MNYLELASKLEDSNYLKFPSMAIEAAVVIRTLNAERHALKQQRDDLLAALNAMRNKYGEYACEVCDQADYAIASVKEKA